LLAVFAGLLYNVPFNILKLPAALLILAALYALASQVGRDPGKRLEPELWKSWGGPPTSALLRWRGNSKANVSHRHQLLEHGLGGGLHLPTEEEEASNSHLADERYENAVAILRGRTRDRARFPLLHAENLNYGFRRNTLGLKSLGLVSCWLTLAWSGALTIATIVTTRLDLLVPNAIIPAAVSVVGLVLWPHANSPWVKTAADAYAARLIEAADLLSVPRAGSA
jgi:hypothetical protein